MADVQQLRSELLEEYGSEEYPFVKTKRIEDLTTEKLITILKEKNFPIEDRNDRQFLQNLLRAALDGSDDVVTVDLVKISSMSREDLESELEKLRRSRRTVSEVQQELANNCGFGDNVIWDLQITSVYKERLL